MALTKVTGAGVEGLSLSSSSTALSIDANGHITMPNQSAFGAYKGSTQNNPALSTLITVTFGTEMFDKNADFDLSTDTFTAPVTGIYQLNASATLQNLDTDASYYRIVIVTSNRSFWTIVDPNFSADNANFHQSISVTADMDAADTAKVQVFFADGTQQADIGAETYFSGALLC
tara:strand:+ start:52 stop:573 length:522 start_codon:yes stop_codon:yes gene_type:complete